MVFSCLAVYVLAKNTRVVPYFYRRVWSPFILKLYYQFGILDDFCVIKKNVYKVILFLSRIINPSLKSENPATCLCTIALFRCVRPVPFRTLREVRVLENAQGASVLRARSNSKRGKQWNINWPPPSRACTGE